MAFFVSILLCTYRNIFGRVGSEFFRGSDVQYQEVTDRDDGRDDHNQSNRHPGDRVVHGAGYRPGAPGGNARMHAARGRFSHPRREEPGDRLGNSDANTQSTMIINAELRA